MMIERDSVHFQILDRLCAMPKAVRGISGAMLERHFHADWAVEELAGAGLIAERGWADGPGTIWVPTAAGEALWRELIARAQEEARAGAAD
ncbi:MAG TPA: hypothetical protein VFV80_08310 [Geminicoccaceae bacterium]|nr:hypothetical protein [Geminicoccaceae bacterium]